MKNGILTIFTFISAIFFPWPLTAVLALITAFFEPLIPLAVGLFADALYFVPSVGAWPVYTLYGCLASISVFLIRSQLQANLR